MSRRRKTESQGVSMDSLMDTLTNVVGILMIILILIQLNVSQAIVKIISEIPPIDVEQFEELELDARAAAARLEERRQQLRDTAENRTELTTVKRELADLQARLQEQDAELLALETLLEARRRARAMLEQLRETARGLLAERNRLRELLAEPAPVPPPAVAVSLPSAQPLPKNAALETFYLTGGQVYHLNLEAIENAVLAEIGLHRDKLQIREEQHGDRKLPVLDQTKLHQHFEELKMKAGPFHVRIPMNPTRNQVALRVTPVEGEGMEIDGRLLAPYPALLRSLRGSNTVAFFRVTPDSFGDYDKARNIAENAGLAVGWEPATDLAAGKRLDQFLVNQLREPPPPQPQPPPDPNAINIPPPRRTLD